MHSLDCQIKKVLIKHNKNDFELTDEASIKKIQEILSFRKKDLIKFKPNYWMEISGIDCNFEIGVNKNYKLSSKLHMRKVLIFG